MEHLILIHMSKKLCLRQILERLRQDKSAGQRKAVWNADSQLTLIGSLLWICIKIYKEAIVLIRLFLACITKQQDEQAVFLASSMVESLPEHEEQLAC